MSRSPTARPASASRPPRRGRRPIVESLEGRQLMTAGAVDPTFGSGAGYVKTDLGTDGDVARAVAIQPWDGKTVLASSDPTTTSGTDFALIRYNADGSLDTSFGRGGIVKTDFYGGNDNINAIVFTPSHQVIAIGNAY